MGSLTAEYRHEPVMLDEVLRELDPQTGDVVCDCTLGGAGHTLALAQRLGNTGLSIGIDQDPAALKAAEQRLEREAPHLNHRFLRGNFGQLDELLASIPVSGVDCFLFDLGVSSPQLDIPQRGFSYKEDAPLDMRMDPENNTLTAAEIINSYTEPDLVRILRMYGDESFAPRIAREICRRRQDRPLHTTLELVDAIKAAIPAAARRHGAHPAKKSFQAIRIEVNHELDVLEQALRAAVRWTNPNGKICVISYHSLEDKIVKHVFSELSKTCTCPPDFPVCVCGNVPVVKPLTKRPLTASERELSSNPRARSAKMRVATRLDTSNARLRLA